MMEKVWIWIMAHPWMTLFLGLSVMWTAERILAWPFRLVNRWIRHRNIVAQGWPPLHVDGDGDFRPESKS